MNKCRISKAFLTDLKQGLKGKIKNLKVRNFLDKWQLEAKGNKLYHWGREVVSQEDVEKILKFEAEQNGMPLSRDGAFEYLKKKYVGFKKRAVGARLKRVEQLQMIHRRPFKNTRAARHVKEGNTNFFMGKSRLGRYNLGIDLFQMPKPQWSYYSYFFVAVLQRNGYCWIIPMKNKKAKTALSCLKKVFQDCKKRFGSIPTGITSDNGGEFMAEMDEFLQSKGIERKIVRLCAWVEKKNSTAFRIFGVLRNIHGFKKSLELTKLKVNNIKNRVTRKAPVDWTKEDFDKPAKRYNRKLKHIPKLRKQPDFELEDRVRTLMKQAMGKEPFYKSYEGLRSKHHQMWSSKIFTITAKRKKDFGFIYKVNNKWRPPYELQLIPDGLVTLEKSKRPPAKKRIRRRAPDQPALRQNVPPLEVSSLKLRRSKRIRRAPVRYAF